MAEGNDRDHDELLLQVVLLILAMQEGDTEKVRRLYDEFEQEWMRKPLPKSDDQ